MAVVIKYVFCSINSSFFRLRGVQWFLFSHPNRSEVDMDLPNFHFSWLHVIYSQTPTKKEILICHVCIASPIKMLKPDFPEMEMRPEVICLSFFFLFLAFSSSYDLSSLLQFQIIRTYSEIGRSSFFDVSLGLFLAGY